MIDIDYIFRLFDWNNSNNVQSKGLELAKEVKCISVFIQPGNPYGKNIWDNCAKALAERSDEELEPYLIELLEWLQDMNWPGAFCVFDRLQKYANNRTLCVMLNICIKKAQILNDEMWASNLILLQNKLADGSISSTKTTE